MITKNRFFRKLGIVSILIILFIFGYFNHQFCLWYANSDVFLGFLSATIGVLSLWIIYLLQRVSIYKNRENVSEKDFQLMLDQVYKWRDKYYTLKSKRDEKLNNQKRS